MNRQMICISCPVGCHLTAVVDAEGNVTVTGNQCERGVTYGREEMLAPKRVVTAVVKTDSQVLPYLPVKTTAPLLKEHIPGLLNTIYRTVAGTPVAAGDVLLADYLGTGIDVIFTRGCG